MPRQNPKTTRNQQLKKLQKTYNSSHLEQPENTLQTCMKFLGIIKSPRDHYIKTHPHLNDHLVDQKINFARILNTIPWSRNLICQPYLLFIAQLRHGRRYTPDTNKYRTSSRKKPTRNKSTKSTKTRITTTKIRRAHPWHEWYSNKWWWWW